MEWSSTLADRDVVLVREATPNGPRVVVHGRGGPQFTCQTYAEAEVRALAYAEQAHACVWYADARGRQLVASFVRVALGTPASAHSE